MWVQLRIIALRATLYSPLTQGQVDIQINVIVDKVNAGENQTVAVQTLLGVGERIRLMCQLLSKEDEK